MRPERRARRSAPRPRSSLLLAAPASADGRGIAPADQLGDRATRPPTATRRSSPSAASTPTSAPAPTIVDGNWEVAYFAGDDEVALVIVDPRQRRGRRVVDRLPGRLEDGARLLGRLRPQAQRPLRLPAALRALPARPGRLAPAAGGSPTSTSLVLLGFGVSHFFFNRAEIGVSVPLVYPLLLYLLGRGALDRLPRARRGAAPGLAGDLAADRRALPDRLPGRAQRRRLGRDRRRLRRASSAPTASPTANRSTTTSPRTSRRATPTARSTTTPTSPSSGSGPGRAPGTTCRPPTAPRSLFDLAAFALLILLGRRIRPGPAGHKLAATLAFGWAAFPYTAYVLESNSNDALVAVLLIAILLALARPAAPRRPGGARDLHQVRPGAPRPDARHLLRTSAGGADDEGSRTAWPAGPPSSVTGPAVVRFVLASSVTRRRDDLARDRPRPAHLLRAHDRLPGRPQLPVQHLGPGRPRAAAHRDPRRRRQPSRSPSPSGPDARP